MRLLGKIAYTGLAFAALGTVPALAHTGVPGHVHTGLTAGILHPLTGIDHMLAILAVGFWSALAFKKSTHVAAAPFAFVIAMLAGAGLSFLGSGFPFAETGIALSVAALGLLILAKVELSVATGCCLVGLFALCHGYAHGAEASGAVGAYMAGFAITTAMLHVAGIGLSRALTKVRLAAPAIGAGLTVAGAYLLAS